MKIKYLIFLALLSMLFLYGCSGNEETTSVQGRAVQEVVVIPEIPSCDDNNPCTEDFFSSEIEECENRKLAYCCGDGICDPNERCNLDIHKTQCPQDCHKECPAFVVVDDFKCVGGCVDNGGGYDITGYARLTTTLENIGERALSGVSSEYVCRRGNREIYSDGYGSGTNGVTVRGFFDSGKDTITLTGEDFGRNRESYHLEFSGVADEELEITCNILFSAPEFYHTESIMVKLL